MERITISDTNSSAARPGRTPADADGIQVNFCKNPTCSNYGVAPKTTVLRGRTDQGLQDSYLVQAAGGIPVLHCRECGENPPIKSNMAIAEELARFLDDLAIAPEPSCPDESCANHAVPVGKGYQSIGLSPSGSRRYRCNLCKKTFSVGKSTTGHKQPHKNRLIFSLLMNKSPIRREEKATPVCRPCGVPSLNRKQAGLRNSRYALRQSSPKPPLVCV